LLNPTFWNIGAIASSITYFALLAHLMSMTLGGGKPKSELLFSITVVCFFAMPLIGVVACTMAIFLDLRQKKWVWLVAVLFFAFPFVLHLQMLLFPR